MFRQQWDLTRNQKPTPPTPKILGSLATCSLVTMGQKVITRNIRKYFEINYSKNNI